QAQVLEHQVGAETAAVAARSRAVFHDLGEGVVDFRAPAAAAGRVDHAGQHLGVHAKGDTKRHGFGGADHGDAQQQVVGDLRHLAVAAVTAVNDVLAHGCENGLGLAKIG